MNAKTFKGILYGVAIAIAVSAGAATVYNYFPPPGMAYSPTTGFTVGSPTGGAQGAGTINAQGVFVNGTAVNTNNAAGSNTQVQYNNSGSFGASSLLTFTSGSVVLNLGAATTPGTYSVGQLDSMVVNGVTVPIPGFALNSNIQGVFENHSYVNGVASGGARYYGVRSEGTISSPLIVSNGDHLSTFYAAGYNGSSYSLGGAILFQVNGTPGASAMPTDMLVQLSPTGSQTPATVATFSHTGQLALSAPSTTTPALQVNGAANSTSENITGSSTSGQSFGLSINAGTTSADYGLAVNNQTGSTTFLKVFGDGGTVLGSATGGDQGVGTLNMQGCFVNGVACSTGGAAGANPTGTVGLTAVNGVAGTYMRSDAAPPLSQAIAPTWTGTHTFANTTANAVFNNSGAALNAKNTVALVTSSGSFALESSNDATPTTPVTLGMSLTRSGAAFTSVNFGNTTDNPVFNFLGTGTATFNGNLTDQPTTSAGYGLFSLNDQTSARKLQVVFVGSTATPAYGIAAGNAGIDTASGVSLTLSTADTARLVIDASGGIFTSGQTGQGAGSINSGTLYLQGNPVYREVAWAGTCTSGGCTTGIAKGVGTAATRNSAGNYTVNFSNSSLSGNESCTASPWSTLSNGAISATVASANTTSVTVTVINTSGTAVDSGFTVLCIG